MAFCSTPAFVYFGRNGPFGSNWIKIGRSWDPKRRSIRHINKFPNFELISVYEFKEDYQAVDAESVLHRYFNAYRIQKRHEWFYPSRHLQILILLGMRTFQIRGEKHTVAKRFTDTEKWAKPLFHDLEMKMKLVWIYICDNCDHAGIWDVNMKLLSFQVGCDVTADDISNAFGDKVQWLDSGKKLFIESFIDFQYGGLNPTNRVHQSVLTRLEKLGVSMGLTSPLQGVKDKDIDKEKEMEMEMDKVKEKEKEKDKFINFPKQKIEFIYSRYPRKEGKSVGIKRLKTQIKNEKDLEDFGRAVDNYVDFCKRERRPKEFIKQFSTFITEWRDWLSDETGTSQDFGRSKSFAQQRSDANAELYRKAQEGAFDEYES